ncbi:MAG: fatty acid desaturase family protein [Litorimonas sp.]
MGASATYLPRETVRTLSRRSDLWGAWLTLHVWGVVFAAWAMAILWTNPLTILLAILLVGSRQHGMAILMHDAAHGVLFKTKALNEFVGKWLLGAPYGGDMAAYRRYHLKHHRYTQTEDDPDLPLSAKFPTSRASLRRKFLRDLTGQTFLRLRLASLKSKSEPGMEAFEKTSAWPYLITNGVLFGGLALLGQWWVYPVLWLLPLATWFMAVLRNRNIAEHALTSTDGNVLTQARTTRANWIARMFLAPYWVNYHVEHHAYMFVPCWQLPRLHRAMVAHHGDMELQPGYRQVLRLAATG